MKIHVTMKSLAKRKDYLTEKQIFLEETPRTLRELLTVLVTSNVQEFNATQTETNLVSSLTND
jgi:hypothetical protein